MNNRIEEKFKFLKSQKKKAFIAYITVGDPSLKVTQDLVLALERVGVDIVELGIPFSDPLADGPTIQAASQRALKNRVTLKKIFETVKAIRKQSQIPLGLMTYYNPVFHYGQERFLKDAQAVGVDAMIVPDLPVEEAKEYCLEAKKRNLSTVFFVAPTTVNERIPGIVRASTGFIYYVSLTGVTGARKKIPSDVKNHIRAVKKLTGKPICVGFGISNQEQIRKIAPVADGVIIGSAIIQEIQKNAGKKDLVKNVSGFVSGLVNALKEI